MRCGVGAAISRINQLGTHFFRIGRNVEVLHRDGLIAQAIGDCGEVNTGAGI